MRAIMLSIQSKWLAKILNGEKTLELRKSAPKDFVGWVYLYCTKVKPYLYKYIDNTWKLSDVHYTCYDVNGKVVARFWLDEYLDIPLDMYYGSTIIGSCVSPEDIINYSKGKNIYAWHIKKLEIFDTPKELSEFYTYKKMWVHCGMDCPPYVDEVKVQLTKAPQSYQFVEVKEVKE